jgi:hypothetical protein
VKLSDKKYQLSNIKRINLHKNLKLHRQSPLSKNEADLPKSECDALKDEE